MNEALQALEIKVENGGATPQGKFFAKDWNTLVEAVKQLDLAEFDEAAIKKYLKDNGYITSDDIPSTDLSNLVTLSTEQTIPGPKNFTGGIKVNGQPLIYNAELGVWELTGDLLVTGNVAWFASIKGFKPSTIMDAVQVDGETIVKNELGQLKVIGGGSGGSGGGLTVSDLSNYLTTNKYTKQSDVETLISTALTPYALTAAIPTNNNQLSNGAGYITSSALDGYATQSWVEGKKYLTGITSSQVTTALGYTPYNSSNPDKYIKGIDYDMVIAALGYTPYSTTNPMGYLTISSLLGYATEQWVGDNYLASSNFTKANIKSTLGISDWALAATKPSYTAAEVGALSTSGGTVSGTEEAVLKINTSYAVGVAVNFRVGNNSRAWVGYNTSDGAYLGDSDRGYTIRIGTDGKPYYRSYELIHANNIGSYNAGSATKLATPRTIWGQSFDGSKDISGLLTDVAGIRGSTTDGGYIGDRNKGIGATDGGSMIYNYSASPITFHINGSERMRITDGGNIAIGDTTADYKFHVHGIGAFKDGVWAQGICLQNTDEINSYGSLGGSGNGSLYLNFRSSGLVSLAYGGGNVAIGRTSADAKLHIQYDSGTTGIELHRKGEESSIGFSSTVNNTRFVAGIWANCFNIWEANKGTIMAIADNGATINGNLLVNGNLSWITQSQRSLKHITSEQGLSLAQLERIKPIKFYWKDGRDSILHVGGVADVFAEVLPEVVSRWKDTLCLNYVDAGFYVGASLIAPVVDHERRIAQLERENEELKKKLNQLAA